MVPQFESRYEKTCLRGFPTRPDTSQAVQPQIMVRNLIFRIKEEEGLYYLCSVNKALISCAVNL